MISTRVKILDIPLDEVIVVGSGVMDELGLKKSNDIDLCVTPRLFALLQIRDGWRNVTFKDGNAGLAYQDNEYEYEAMRSFGGADNASTVADLRKTSVQLNGVYFLSPTHLLEWKQNKNRPKDRADIKLLQIYIKST